MIGFLLILVFSFMLFVKIFRKNKSNFKGSVFDKFLVVIAMLLIMSDTIMIIFVIYVFNCYVMLFIAAFFKCLQICFSFMFLLFCEVFEIIFTVMVPKRAMEKDNVSSQSNRRVTT